MAALVPGQRGGERLAPASLAALPFVRKTLLDRCGMPGSWEAVLARQACATSNNRDKGKLLCVLKFPFRKCDSSKSDAVV